MKSRLFVAALAVVAFAVVGPLRAAEKVELKCPVSGKAASADHKVAFNGGEVEFCCPNCPKAFAKNPKKFAAKANLQLVQTKQLKQVKCPLTGKPMNPTKVVKLAGTEIHVCCGNCLAKVNKLASDDEKIECLLSDTSKGFKPAKE
jgi:YHS domain-containing protein